LADSTESSNEIKIITVNTGTTEQWANQVRPLEAGEFGYNLDTGELKIGDGTTAFASLGSFINGVMVNGEPV
jgi:hypothetical protein